jgi:hypothetical protein
MSRIFMSYSRSDGAYANQLYRALRNLHVEGFLDEADIAAGARWDTRIKDAIRNADAVVVLISESGVRSSYVMAEVGLAWETNKRIIPVIPAGASIETSELPAILQDFNVLDARRQSPDDIAERIAQSVAGPQQGVIQGSG